MKIRNIGNGSFIVFGVTWLHVWPSLSLNEVYDYEKHVECLTWWIKVKVYLELDEN